VVDSESQKTHPAKIGPDGAPGGARATRRRPGYPAVPGPPGGVDSHAYHGTAMELPKKIGRYEIIKVIGQGMRMVYKARDPEFDRLVTLNV
jgi:hypothetical protein